MATEKQSLQSPEHCVRATLCEFKWSRIQYITTLDFRPMTTIKHAG